MENMKLINVGKVCVECSTTYRIPYLLSKVVCSNCGQTLELSVAYKNSVVSHYKELGIYDRQIALAR